MNEEQRSTARDDMTATNAGSLDGAGMADDATLQEDVMTDSTADTVESESTEGAAEATSRTETFGERIGNDGNDAGTTDTPHHHSDQTDEASDDRNWMEKAEDKVKDVLDTD